jgi:hypothetical protein
MSINRNLTWGVWHSQNKDKTIKIKSSNHSYYDVTETNKRTKHVQHIKVGREGADQFINELVQNAWVNKAR